MSDLTLNMLESNMATLDSAVGELRDEQWFDLADTLEETLLFLRFLKNADLLLSAVEPDDAPVTGDMSTLREMCVAMKTLQNKALDLKAAAAEVKIPLDDLRLRKIPELMQHLEVKTATFQGLGRVQTAPDLYASTKKGKKPDAMQWLRDCGYEGMITETYNASSLKALFRRQLTEGVDIPDEIFNVTPFIRASIVKA